MGRYLEIADRALSEITESQSLTESEVKDDSPTQCERSELSELSPDDTFRLNRSGSLLRAAKAPRPRQSALREVAGSDRAEESIRRPDWSKSLLMQSVDNWSRRLQASPEKLRLAAADDWDEISGDPSKLTAFADLLATYEIRELGGLPDTYTTVATCRNCGDVPIYENCPLKVKACVWCMNGQTPPPIPGHTT